MKADFLHYSMSQTFYSALKTFREKKSIYIYINRTNKFPLNCLMFVDLSTDYTFTKAVQKIYLYEFTEDLPSGDECSRLKLNDRQVSPASAASRQTKTLFFFFFPAKDR